MQINKLLTPYNLNRLGDTSRIKYIVLHYVGATGGAEANCRYYASKYIGASAHYYVGFDGEIWQSVEMRHCLALRGKKLPASGMPQLQQYRHGVVCSE